MLEYSNLAQASISLDRPKNCPKLQNMMIRRSEGHITSIDKLDLFYQFWECPTPKGTIVVTHGLGEHSDCYNEFAHRLAESGWNVLAWDLRGHGRSCGQRGFVDSFSDYEMDLATLINKVIETKKSPKPYILFGHSMGGLITLRYIMSHEQSDYLAMCLSSPLLGVAVKVPPIKKKFAKSIGRLLPRLTLSNEIDYKHLVRDPEHIQTYDKDPLRQNRVSPNLFLGILKNCELAMEQAGRIELPFLLQIAGNDKIVNAPKSEAFFQKVSSETKVFHKYSESMHEIFNDLDKDIVYSDLIDFLNNLKM